MCQDCQKKTFYITTPIYYPSDNLHIGHAYCSTGGGYHGAVQENDGDTIPTSLPVPTSTARRSSAKPRRRA